MQIRSITSLRFSNILWLDASSEATIELGLMQIAHANNAPPEAKPSAGAVLKWISQKTKWLVVYDGADGHYSVVEKFLPPGNGGNIMITSRNVGLKRLTLDSVNVLHMADDEAVPLLLKSAMLYGTSGHIKHMAQNVALELGGIPLALDQAGGYIQSCGCSIDDYFELFKKHKHQVLSKKGFKGASGYGMSTYGAWDISMQQIENMAASKEGEEAEAAHSAIRLLRIFAFLNHENIPEELFKNAAKNYIQRHGEEEKYESQLSVNLLNDQTLFLSEDGEWDRMQFLDGIQVLLSFSLVKSVKYLYSMHSLVNAWNRGCVPKLEVENYYYRARALLSCSIAFDWNIDNYEFCRLLAPHIRSNCEDVTLPHIIRSNLAGFSGIQWNPMESSVNFLAQWLTETFIPANANSGPNVTNSPVSDRTEFRRNHLKVGGSSRSFLKLT